MSVQILSRPGLNLAYRSQGDGDCVILIHALAMTQDLWNSLVDDWSTKFHVVSFDLRGHGGTSAPDDGNYAFDALAFDVVQLMDHLKIERADLVGISVGGEVAQVAAATYPDRFGRLVLTSTACFTNPARAAIWKERVADARRLGMSGIAEATVHRWFSASFARSHPETLAWSRGVVAATPISTYAAVAHVIQGMDLRPLIRGIENPTLVVCGELDGNTGSVSGQMLVDCISQAKLVVMPAVGHFPNLESPHGFASLCAGFLTHA